MTDTITAPVATAEVSTSAARVDKIKAAQKRLQAKKAQKPASKPAKLATIEAAKPQAPKEVASTKKPAKALKLAKLQVHWDGSVLTTKRPGCVATILAMLSAASESRPVTKKEIGDELVKRFPERDERKMRATVSGLTTWIPLERKGEVFVKRLGRECGYWMKLNPYASN